MFTPVYIQLGYWFYPTGNTPAVNLLRDIPTTAIDEEDTIRLLLLGCGDPRNVLFSLWNEQEHTRNVILLTLATEKCSCKEKSTNYERDSWNLFYHLFVPETALKLLRKHAECLLSASESLQQWHHSPFGQSIGFLSRDSLRQIRGFWVSYATTQDQDQFERRARSVIEKRSQDISYSILINGVRAAGPFWFAATEIMSHAYRAYWKTGVVGGNAKDLADLGNNGRGLVNPMFAVSSAPAGDYAVHYGTEPLLGFHVAEAFSNGAKGSSQTKDAVFDVAKAQFKDWCCSFKKYADHGRIRLELFSGEAITLCYELQLQIAFREKIDMSARSYVKPWTSRPLLLDGTSALTETGIGAFSHFDIIDTSNLSDHLGLINILTATSLLLQKSPYSVLYTESLLKASESSERSLADVLGSDVATFALLIGVVPVGLLSGITMEAVSNEKAMLKMAMSVMAGSGKGAQQQYRMRVPWKFPGSTDPINVKSAQKLALPNLEVEFEPQALAGYLFSIYTRMFAHEDPSNIRSRMERMTISTQFSTDMQRYTRAAMVALLRIVKTRVITDWERAISLFYSQVEDDRTLLVGSNSLQELSMHLHQFGICTLEVLRCGPRQIRNLPGLVLRSRPGEVGLLAEEEVPALVHLVLLVPRKSLSVFTSENPNTMGSPALHLSVTQVASGHTFENIFSSIHCSFGTLISDKNAFGDIQIEEDSRGWMGSADLVVTCQVPAFVLLTGPKEGLRIALVISTSPEAAMKFVPKLGPQLRVFETIFGDSNRVRVCRNAPGLRSQEAIKVQKSWVQLYSKHEKPMSRSMVTLDSRGKATQLQQRVNFPPGSTESRALSAGKSVTATGASPSTIRLDVYDKVSRSLYFPFHIDGSRSKIRVARKSSWVEVLVPIHTAPSTDHFDSWTQLLLPTDQRPYLWAIPKVSLSIQPCISSKPGKAKDMSWIKSSLCPTASDAETAISPMHDLKQTVNLIFGSFGGIAGKTGRVFLLGVEQICHTIVFVNALRHDLDLGSIVLDTCVVPLTDSNSDKLERALGKLETKQAIGIGIGKRESILWKRHIPALVERCRTWAHKTTCEYQQKGATAPLSVEEEQSPLCSCGEGQNLPQCFKHEDDGDWAPFAKYATRMAIAPIFPVPYVESSMSRTKKTTGSSTNPPSANSHAAPTISEASGVGGRDSGSSSVESEKCENCGNTSGPFKKCARCGKARYCNHACQKAAWKEHKKACSQVVG